MNVKEIIDYIRKIKFDEWNVEKR